MVTVKIPATSANMGPGFDNLGIALTIYNTFTVEEVADGLIIEGCAPEFRNADNLFYTSMMRGFERMGYEPKGYKITVKNDIPVCSGLGSSSSCVVGGIMAANELAGHPLRTNDLVNLATEIEGHPDNVAPALLGNMVIAVMDSGKVYFNKLKVATGLRFIAVTPDFSLPTEKARAILPTTVPFEDAIFNVGRNGLMISSLVNGHFDNLHAACQDRLHQPYRKGLIDEWDEVFDAAESVSAAATFLSGAGPTIMTILADSDNDPLPKLAERIGMLSKNWTIRELRIDWRGARIIDAAN